MISKNVKNAKKDINNQKGKFIAIEGIDGSGKTTLIQKLGEYFTENQLPHKITKQPTDKETGQLIRKVLNGKVYLPEESIALLFAADRAVHIKEDILPKLEENVHVICDRYLYSSIAYQGTALPIEVVFAYNQRFFIVPNLTIFIDTAPEECERRIAATRPNRDIYERPKHAKIIRKKYLEAFELYSEIMPVSIIDGNQPTDTVFLTTLKLLQTLGL
ncbi:MAG: dTMP kinase [Firmicutes bacterium]|nr:dTMP kinase [Bacillota bacterium]